MIAKNMKIAFVLDDTLDRPDGVQQYVLTLAAWLTRFNHQVMFICSEASRNDLDNCYSITKNISVAFNKNRLSIPLPAKKSTIYSVLLQEKPDVVHLQMPHSPFLGGRVVRSCQKIGIPVIGTFHVAPFSIVEKSGFALMRPFYQRQAKLINRTVSVSPTACAEAEKTLRVKSHVIPNAVDIARFNKSSKQITKHRGIDIRFLGRLVPRKGCKYALLAFHRVLQQTDKRLHLTIGGRGQLEQSLRSYVDKHELYDNVTFAGFVSESEKVEFLTQADIIVLPSTGGESFGISVVEAMAIPSAAVIAGDNVGYRYVVDDDTSLVQATDTEAFSKKLLSLITAKKLRHEIARKQSKRAQEFDISTIGPQLEAEYRYLLRSHK